MGVCVCVLRVPFLGFKGKPRGRQAIWVFYDSIDPKPWHFAGLCHFGPLGCQAIGLAK